MADNTITSPVKPSPPSTPPVVNSKPKPTDKPNKNNPPPANSFPYNLIQTTQTNTYKKDDPPLVDLKVTNPITYAKRWWNRIMANEGIIFSFRIRPLTAMAIASSVAFFFGGTGFGIAKVFFPDSSPILKREVFYQGTFKSSQGNNYLTLPNNQIYRLEIPNKIKYSSYLNRSVLIKGNLDKEPNLIKVTEIVGF